MSTDNDLLVTAQDHSRQPADNAEPPSESSKASRPPATRPATDPTTQIAEVETEAAPIPLLEQVRVALRGASRRFRLPTEDDTPPATVRLFGMATWAAACVFLGLIPAGRLMAAMMFTGAPGWFMPVAVTLGVLGIGLIAAAFGSIHRAYLPWHLLGVASLLLVTNLALVYIAL